MKWFWDLAIKTRYGLTWVKTFWHFGSNLSIIQYSITLIRSKIIISKLLPAHSKYQLPSYPFNKHGSFSNSQYLVFGFTFSQYLAFKWRLVEPLFLASYQWQSRLAKHLDNKFWKLIAKHLSFWEPNLNFLRFHLKLASDESELCETGLKDMFSSL